MYKPWDEILVKDKKYYFQFYARYSGADHIIVCESPKGEKYNKYHCLADLMEKF